jgi:hypothetical protein
MTNPAIDDIIKQLVLAHADGEIRSICVVLINGEHEPEIKSAVSSECSYAINFGIDVAKADLLSNVIRNAMNPGKERE